MAILGELRLWSFIFSFFQWSGSSKFSLVNVHCWVKRENYWKLLCFGDGWSWRKDDLPNNSVVPALCPWPPSPLPRAAHRPRRCTWGLTLLPAWAWHFPTAKSAWDRPAPTLPGCVLPDVRGHCMLRGTACFLILCRLENYKWKW